MQGNQKNKLEYRKALKFYIETILQINLAIG
jgi:hypothetical protein